MTERNSDKAPTLTDSDSLVEWLREGFNWSPHGAWACQQLMYKAAGRIEQLERELAEARNKALEDAAVVVEFRSRNRHGWDKNGDAAALRALKNNAGSPTATADSAARNETVGPEAKAQAPCSGSPAPSAQPCVVLTRQNIADAIEKHPLIASLLYDLDLMPEQIKKGDERREGYMYAVVDHFLHALPAERNDERPKP